MVTILGSGGAISKELVPRLCAAGRKVRLVSRNPSALGSGVETVAADVTDLQQTVAAVAGSSLVFLLAGLKYDHRVWAEAWPRVMSNSIEACKRAGARLVFFDNVYMYGRVNGPMTEETPFNPASRKGEIRARIATQLNEEWKSASVTAMIVRAADFYGPGAAHGIPNVLVFEPLSKGNSAMVLAADSLPHSYSYTLDCAEALVKLADTGTAWNQTWHVPTAPDPPAAREFIAMAAAAMGAKPKYRVLGPGMVRIAGWFRPEVGEVREMLYQNDAPYLFDSSKYARAFGFKGTPYAEGIRATAQSYRPA
jgi:nucleoside-diphosphate-sugar epimerase